jgi:hypothetical protein
MSFNIKDNQLLPGSLIRFDGPSESYAPGISGKVGIVLSHEKPAYLDVLVAGRLVQFNFAGAVPINGWISEFSLVAGPDGKPGGGSRPWHT